MKTEWNTLALRSNVETVFGEEAKKEMGLVLESILSRFAHSSYHIDEFQRLVHQAIGGRPGYELLAELLGRPEDRIMAIKNFAEAHAIAAVQALHSLSDNLGTIIMISLRGDINWSGYLRDVSKNLDINENRISSLTECLQDNDDYRYLEALTNQAKHRNIVEISLIVSVDDANPPKSEFITFRRKGKLYSAVEIRKFLIKEYDRQANIFMQVFMELDRLLAIRSI